MKKIYLIFTFILAFCSSIALAVDGDPVIEGMTADSISATEIKAVNAIDAATEATLESELDHDDITGAGTLDTETEIEAGIDHDDISGAGTVDTDEEVQDSIGGILDDGTVGEVVFTYDDITPNIYGTVQESELDHDSLSGAGTVDTAAEVQGVSVGGDLSGTVGNATESDPVYSAWDKDYADLINTPDLFDLLGLADPDADKYPIWDDSETAWAWADGGSMPYPGAGIAVSTGSAWDTSITDNSANWNTAYGWGDHSTEGYWSSSNDGPGSGLDADLWDGYEFSSYLDQAVLSSSSPTFATAKLSNLSNGYLPYHISDSSGLANSPFSTPDGTNAYMTALYDADDFASVYVLNGGAENSAYARLYITKAYGSYAYVQAHAGGSYSEFVTIRATYYGGTEYAVSLYGTSFYPETNNAIDSGTSSKAWQDVYYYTLHDVGDYYFLDDRDDLAIINAIKGSGVIDEKTGLELIDDNTLDPILLSRHETDFEDTETHKIIPAGTVATTPDGKPFINNTVLKSLMLGSIRALDKKVEDLKTENEGLRVWVLELEERIEFLEKNIR